MSAEVTVVVSVAFVVDKSVSLGSFMASVVGKSVFVMSVVVFMVSVVSAVVSVVVVLMVVSAEEITGW